MQNFKTLAAVSRQLQARSLSSLHLCQDLLGEVKALNSSIGAYSDVLVDSALTEAAESDRRHDRGAPRSVLDGVPIAIKDLIDTSPAICKAGLENLSDYRPSEDASVVRALRAAGAVILGVTETDSGAFGTTTPQVINPLAPDRIAGGSSGGSGAAIAAGLAFGAVGTDTGGSIRIPAACCSVSGFKPTWGRVDCSGVRPLAKSLDHIGSLARCVADLQIVHSVFDREITDKAAVDQAGPLVVGTDEAYYHDADPIVKTAINHVLDSIERDDIEINNVRLPGVDTVMYVHMVTAAKEAADYYADQPTSAWLNYPQVARDTIQLGLTCSDEKFEQANQQRSVLTSEVDSLFDQVDAVIVPTLPVDAPHRDTTSISIGSNDMSVLMATIRYTALFNQTGHPVVSIPGYLLADGRAVGMQIVGPRNSDNYLLHLGRRLERLLSVHIDYATILTGHGLLR